MTCSVSNNADKLLIAICLKGGNRTSIQDSLIKEADNFTLHRFDNSSANRVELFVKTKDNSEAVERAANSDYESALWEKLLSISNDNCSEKKTSFCIVTKERLNAALKAVRHCS